MGIGALYYGLPLGRYRNKLLSNIHAKLNSLKIGTDARERMGELLMNDGDTLSSYTTLSPWFGELADSEREIPEGTAADPFDHATNRTKLPNSYRWYEGNWDKKTSISLAIVIPLLGLWLCLVFPDLQELSWFYCVYASLLFIAQGWIACNMYVGSRMVVRITVQFSDGLDNLVSKLAVEASKDTIRSSTWSAVYPLSS